MKKHIKLILIIVVGLLIIGVVYGLLANGIITRNANLDYKNSIIKDTKKKKKTLSVFRELGGDDFANKIIKITERFTKKLQVKQKVIDEQYYLLLLENDNMVRISVIDLVQNKIELALSINDIKDADSIEFMRQMVYLFDETNEINQFFNIKIKEIEKNNKLPEFKLDIRENIIFQGFTVDNIKGQKYSLYVEKTY